MNSTLGSVLPLAMFYYTWPNSQEWLEMEFESFSKETKLTIRQGKDIHRIGKLPNPSLGYWKLVILYYGIINLITSYSHIEKSIENPICSLYKP